MTKHLIFDLETLDNKPTSVVLSMAILVFDPAEILSFEELVSKTKRIKLNYRDQLGGRRTLGEETVEWWKKPEQADARKRVIDYDGTEINLSELPELVKNYLDEMGYDPVADDATVWTRGNNFDPPIIDDIYNQVGADVPYSWWNIRDVRTFIDSITCCFKDHKWQGNDLSFPIPQEFVKHVEEHDCAIDVLKMQYAMMGLMNEMSNLSKWDPNKSPDFSDFDDDIPF